MKINSGLLPGLQSQNPADIGGELMLIELLLKWIAIKNEVKKKTYPFNKYTSIEKVPHFLKVDENN